MATILNADTIAGGAVLTGDSSGIIQLQGGGTARLTFNTSGALGVGSSPAYGSSGQVLTSAGSSAAPAWNTVVAPSTNGTAGQILTSNGTSTPAWASASAPSSLATNATITSVLETATVTAAAPTATTNYDVKTQAVQYYTSNTSTNWTLNVRGDGSTTLNSIMAVGQAITIVLLATNSSTAYYASGFTIDGSSVTPKYQNGTAFSAGNASAIDSYVYTIIKTASATFTVLASQTKYA